MVSLWLLLWSLCTIIKELYHLSNYMQVPGYEQGNFIGPTILCDVRVDMDCCKVAYFWLYFHHRSEQKRIYWVPTNYYSAGWIFWASSPLHAGNYLYNSRLVRKSVLGDTNFSNFLRFLLFQVESLEEAINIINRNQYPKSTFFSFPLFLAKAEYTLLCSLRNVDFLQEFWGGIYLHLVQLNCKEISGRGWSGTGMQITVDGHEQIA